MLDRGIGVAGLALTIIFWALPYFVPKLPSWALKLGLGVGVLLLGISVGLVIADQRTGVSVNQSADKALLRLHIYGDNRIPDKVSAENIFRWYYLKNAIVMNVQNSEQRSDVVSVTLFVTFEPDVKISTIRVSSPDIKLPLYEVKEFNQRYAIITFASDIPPGTLDVLVNP